MYRVSIDQCILGLDISKLITTVDDRLRSKLITFVVYIAEIFLQAEEAIRYCDREVCFE